MLLTEPVGKLLVKFIVPAATGVLLSAMYNVVDRIFVGKGCGEIAFGSLSIASSFMLVITAFSMLFGMGAANLISIKLGEGNKDEAESALIHCFVLQLFFGILILIVGLVFLQPLLVLFGAKPGTESIQYAEDYMRVILYGNVFNMLSFGLSHCTRAQGFKTANMIIMLLGTVINLILDPLFIFVFHMGVKGAAWATIIAQFFSMLVALYYVFAKKGALHVNFTGFRLSLNIVGTIIWFGLSQFMVQFAVSICTAVYNGSLFKYGPGYFGTPSGGDAALAGFSVMLTVTQFVLMPIMGITQGAQPILGFNYGAKRFDRAKSAYIYSALMATAIALVGFLIIRIFPYQLASVFSKEQSADVMDFAVKSLRISTICLPFVGFQIISANYFTVVGQMTKSLILTLSRQGLILIPCILIFGNMWQLDGVIRATPVSDGLACLITGLLIFFEMRKLNERIAAP